MAGIDPGIVDPIVKLPGCIGASGGVAFPMDVEYAVAIGDDTGGAPKWTLRGGAAGGVMICRVTVCVIGGVPTANPPEALSSSRVMMPSPFLSMASKSDCDCATGVCTCVAVP